MKTCRTCNEELPLSSFWASPRNKGGYATECKDCERIRKRKNYQVNKEKIDARNLSYRVANRERYAAYTKKYRENNPEKAKEVYRNWQLKYPEKVREHSHRRRAALRNNGVFVILERDLKRLYSSPCTYCGSTANITADHVVPIARGGVHSIGNLVPACSSCNSSKHSHLVTEWKLKTLRRPVH